MDYIYLITAVLAGIHAFTYGLWLKQNGNKAGAIFIFAVVMVCIGLPFFRIIRGSGN